MLEADSRMHVRRERDAAVRRRLGLPMPRRTAVKGSNARRWTEAEIRAVVKPMRRGEYRKLREQGDPNALPSHNTVFARCPDLFQVGK